MILKRKCCNLHHHKALMCFFSTQYQSTRPKQCLMIHCQPPTSLWRAAGKSDAYTNTHRGRRRDETQIAQLTCVQRRSVDAISTVVACKQNLDKFRKYSQLIHSKPELLWAIYHFLVLIMTDWLSKLIWMMRNLTCISKICFINVIMAADLIKRRKQS